MELQVKRVSNNVVIVNADLDGEKTTVVIDTVNCTRPTLFGYASTPEKLRKMTADLVRAIESKAVKIQVHHRFKLSEAAEAHRALESRATTGQTVLIP